MKLKIYTCHHKPSQFLSDEIFTPLHVGKALSSNDIGCSGDDTGDNISFKNPFYCELTAQYWAWKNDQDSDYIGLMHYRRHLSFSDSQNLPEDNWGVIVDQELNAEYEEKHKLNFSSIRDTVSEFDAILPIKWDVRLAGSKSNYDHYKKGEFLEIKDYQLCLDILLEMYPDYYKAVKSYNSSHLGYYTNMFVMKADVFRCYSEWLFSILDALEDEISLDGYNAQQSRVFGHISERLLGIYIEHNKDSLQLLERQRTFISNEGCGAKIAQKFQVASHPIVICFDDNYAHSGAALIRSIVENSDSSKNYDILILENGVIAKSKKRLLTIIEGLDNFSLRFFDVNSFDELKEVHTRAHFSASTYARLFIPKIFMDQEKVLFIDADTVVCDDVAKLFQVDMGQNLVAAVKDIVMEGFVKFKTISDSETGNLEAHDYLKNYLGMNDPDDYFQAGLIMFNLSEMREDGTFEKLMEVLKDKKYWFLDQDIMNKVFEGRVHFLPMEWNVFHGNGNTHEFFPGLKFATYSKFLKARLNPSMVHFAGDQKPWKNTNVDFSDLYWRSLRDTDWYEDKVNDLLNHVYNDSRTLHESPVVRIAKEEQLRTLIRPYTSKFLPRGTKRRSVAIKVYLRALNIYRSFR